MSGNGFAWVRGGVCIIAAAALLAACTSSDVATIHGATQKQLAAIHVSEVSVKLAIPRPNPGLQAALKSELEKTMPRCARGTVDHRMEVTVTHFNDQNVAKTVLIGDEIELAGRVRLADAATDAVSGEYYVDASFFWGGFIGAAMMSNAESKLSKDFAENVCSEVFGVKLK